MGTVCPLLVQDGSRDPAYAAMPAVRAGFTRYLGVPVFTPVGEAIGTLCFLDTYSDQLLNEDDVRFISLLAMRVSAELERERAIEERLAEQRALVEQLAATNERLRSTAEEKRRFTATVIHDLRQPLTTIHTTLYLLRDENDPEGRAECLDILGERVHVLGEMVEELMQYAEIEAGRLSWRVEDVDLTALLRDCAVGFAPVLTEKGLRLIQEIPPELGTVRTDRAKLTHIVGNLLSNAVKFTEAGHVALRARPEGREWRLEVDDTGVGMPPEVLTRIFDEFYQASDPGVGRRVSGVGRADPSCPSDTRHPTPDTRRSGATTPPLPPGRGLGLSIVRHLCTAMGATVAVTSEPGRGTCFTLRFPREVRPPPLDYGASE